jgi:hypothetical protein
MTAPAAWRLDRFCRVWHDADGAWKWHCRLCDPDPAPFSGRTWSQPLASADAEEHMRTWHTNDPMHLTDFRRAA